MSKYLFIITILFCYCVSIAYGQSNEQHIPKLELKKKQKKVFHEKDRDSTTLLYIDTLIMKDRSSLQFFGKKSVKLVVKYAEIGDRAFISGMAGKNNASDFDIEMNIQKLGSLYIIARGQDAMNGTRTHPNGDGGQVNFLYSAEGVNPQMTNKKEKNYLFADVSAGGRAINPNSDLTQIYSRIATSAPGLRGIPQGQIYSGSPGNEGKFTLKQNTNEK